MHPVDEAVPASLLSHEQREDVMAQLESVLSSSLFRQSKRYPAFLRYVVESTLHGDEGELKERTIGMEVFGRLPNYDTSMDPTVRLTAAEVRKRLAQYYQQSEHTDQLHIALHPGSYVPEFSWPGISATVQLAADQPHLEQKEGTANEAEAVHNVPVPAKMPWRAVGIAASAAVVLMVLAIIGYRAFYAPALKNDLWTPLLRDPNAVTFVMPDLAKTALLPQPDETPKTTVLAHIRENQVVDFNDSVVLARLSAVLGAKGKPLRVLLSSATNFRDLQGGPIVLIGALDNPWTMRFLEPLPYSVAQRGAALSFAIVGTQEPAPSDWSIDLSQPFGTVKQDFGIVARLEDTMTGRPVLILGGIGQNGTAAGIRLLTDSALEREITAGAPKDWSGRNLEVVFRTQIIDDQFGPPVIVARKYW